MRFNITFNRTGKQRMLPMDYQYYTSAWIYKVLGNADREFSSFLHQQGYTDRNKQFKFFCYSLLNFGKPVFWKEKSLFEINSDILSLQVSFMMPDAAEKFIIGLFNQQEAYLGDRFNGLDLLVTGIERLPDPEISESMYYRALSPVVVSFLKEGDKYATYFSPFDVGYSGLIRNNLTQKWQTIPGNTPLPDDFKWEWQLKSEPGSKLVTIKPYTAQQSMVRGFIYEFRLTAPVALHRLIWSSGIGEKNSIGFGWVELK